MATSHCRPPSNYFTILIQFALPLHLEETVFLIPLQLRTVLIFGLLFWAEL